ncbi:MAG: hypothetical protein HY904_15520 [Deltaproteobacteria bacterium]|nr:hypothetical protein [Deltaproteobacteria bacterium]
MSRIYDAELVVLPRLDVPGAIALATQVKTTADAEAQRAPLEGALSRALGRVVAALQVVQRAAKAQAPANNGDPTAAREADLTEDACWSGLKCIVEGYVRFPLLPEKRAAATTIQEAVFPDGMAFTQIPFLKQWAESDTRLSRLEDAEIAAAVNALGLGDLVNQTRAAHTEYGRVLGITEVNAVPTAVPGLLEPLQALNNSLRDWVIKVAASVEPDQPATEERARRLLAPVEAWKSAPAAPKAASDQPIPV